jgi:SAM-dependent methyltransferase
MFSEAEAYERFMGRWSRLLAPQLVVFSEIGNGEAVLDVGSGTGALSTALRAAATHGNVTGVDPSVTYVKHASRRSRDPFLRFVVGDARRLPFENAAFDKTVSALVLNFVPEPARALGEMVRVTKPGGVVTSAVWDYGEGMQMLRVFWDEAAAVDPAAKSRDEAHMPLCAAGQLTALWQEAGLRDVQEVALTVALHFTSFDDYWGPFLLGQGPAGAYASALSPESRRALAQRLRWRLLGDGPNRAIEIHARAWAVKGTASQG